jgi:hypothetical protein
MDCSLKQLLDNNIASKKEWMTECIPFPSKEGQEVNLCDYIGLDCKRIGECFMFPEGYDSTSNCRNSLAKAIKIAAANGKFPLVERGWDAKKRRLRFECFRSRSHDADRYKTKQNSLSNVAIKHRNVSFIRPQKGKECPFRFSIFWMTEHKQWCLFGGVKGSCRFHCHHLPMDPCEVKKSISYIDGGEVKIALDAAKSNAPPSVIGRLLNIRTGDILSGSSLKNIRMQAEKGERNKFGANDNFTTQADQLLAYLESTPDVSFCAIYDEPDSPLFTVYKQRAKTGRRHLHTSTRSISGGIAQQEVLNEKVLDAIDPRGELDDYIDRTRRAFKLKGNEKMLLGVAWTDNESRRIFARYSEIMVADVTEGTNNAKRPLFLFSGKTSNQNTFTALWAFLPQQSRWAFRWVWTRCIPQLLPEQGLNRMRLLITDGDPREYGTFLDAIPTWYSLCRHKLCHWHLLYRGSLMKAQTGNCGTKAKILFHVVLKWIESWMTKIETQEEYNLSTGLLIDWLKSPEALDTNLGGMGCALVSQINAFLTSSLFPHEQRWARYHFLNVRAFNTSASSYGEAENSALKRRGDGVKPNFSVPKATRAINEGTQLRTVKRQQKAVHNLNATKKTKAANYTNISDLVDCIQETISHEFNAAKKYDLFCPGPKEFWVKRAWYQIPSETYQDFNDSNFCQFMIPQFERTRIVKITEIEGELYLECSCGKFQRQASPCAHIYKVLNRPPQSTDVSVRWTKIWDVYLHRPGYHDLSDQLEELYKKERPGPHFENTNQWEVGKGEREYNYFKRSLPSEPTIIQKYSRWADSFSRQPGCYVHKSTEQETVPAASGMVQELTSLSQGYAIETQLDSEMDVGDVTVMQVEEIDSNLSKSGKSPYTNNLHFYEEISKLAKFNSKAADIMTKGMQETLELLQKHVAEGSGMVDYSIGPAIGKEPVGQRLRPSYSPSKSKNLRDRQKETKAKFWWLNK